VSDESANPRSLARIVVQLVGFGLSLALLGWCVSLALSEENRQAFENLRSGSGVQAGGLIALSLGTIAVNGVAWWALMRPVRALDLGGVSAVNALATLLSYLPFKLSVMARVALHNRRDGVTIMRMGAWFAAFSAMVVVVVGPVVLVGLWRRSTDRVWWVGSVTLLMVAVAGLFVASRLFRGAEGTARVRAIAGVLRIGLLDRFLRSNAYAHLHDGFTMTGHGPAVLVAGAMRVADLVIQAARFYVAARILGVELGADAAVLLSVVYFAIGVASPFGVVGTREGGTTLIAGALAGGNEQLAAIALLVSGSEALAALAAGGVSVAFLRPWGLVGRKATGTRHSAFEEVDSDSGTKAERPNASEDRSVVGDP